MSDRCVRCGKAAVVRRVLPPTDPLGVAGGPLPVCMECAAAIDAGDAVAPSGQGLVKTTAGGNVKSGTSFLLLAVLAVLFAAALFAFIHANNSGP